MADFFTRVPGPLEVMRRMGLNVPSSKQLGKFSTAVPEFVGPQADVAGMVRDAGQVMPNIRSGDYGQALANLGMAAAAIPFMALPGTVSQVKGVTKKITDELPMDTASRMARAEDMGFNPQTYYHGTPVGDIRKFDPNIRTGSDRRLGATYFSSDPSLASEFSTGIHSGVPSGSPKSVMFPVKIKTKEIFDYKNSDHLKKLESKVDKAIASDEFGRKFPDYDLQTDLDLVKTGEWDAFENPKIQKILKKFGFKGYKTHEPGTVGLFYSDKGDVRSVFAKFNPSKKTSANILAGTAGGMLFAPAFTDNE